MWEALVVNAIALVFGVATVWLIVLVVRWNVLRAIRSPITVETRKHFNAPIADLAVSERKFPGEIRVEVQRAVVELMQEAQLVFFSGLQCSAYGAAPSFASIIEAKFGPTAEFSAAPPTYEDLDVGEDEPLRVLANGLWLATKDGLKIGVIYTFDSERRDQAYVQFATFKGATGEQAAAAFFRGVETAVQAAHAYRGKVLSLESQQTYTGQTTGVKVHRLSKLTREQVILPRKTLELLDRNVVAFVQSRPSLSRFRMPTKKGLLFYGPPGTGKTHTIRYLAGALPNHTTLLVTASQVCLLSSYVTLARLLQPSIVVIEDVDLVARDRESLRDSQSESLLNKLLNEMDGLKEDCEMIFILTTNRPQHLEAALASRPGRIDQAIEFPLPDDEGREKLIRLYSQGLSLSDEVVEDAMRRTQNVSASFIKELMRRSAHFHLEHDDSATLHIDDVKRALDEMVFSGGALNLKLLGAEGVRYDDSLL